MPCRVALSMRVVAASSRHGRCDAVEQDWHGFLRECGIVALPVPNVGEGAVDWLDGIELDGVVLSGGNDICPETYGASGTLPNAFPERDRTEVALVRLARSRGIPLVGVCRGMLMLNVFFGGTLLQDIKEEIPGAGNHLRAIHPCAVTSPHIAEVLGAASLKVNSYHTQGVTEVELSPELRPFASCPAGVLEGIHHPELPFVGIQWHPERDNPASAWDRQLFSRIFVHMEWE